MPANLRRDLGAVESYAALLGILIGAGIGAWLKVISYIGALAYLANAFADYVAQLVPAIPHDAAAIGSLLFFYAIHVAGVRLWSAATASRRSNSNATHASGKAAD